MSYIILKMREEGFEPSKTLSHTVLSRILLTAQEPPLIIETEERGFLSIWFALNDYIFRYYSASFQTLPKWQESIPSSPTSSSFSSPRLARHQSSHALLGHRYHLCCYRDHHCVNRIKIKNE